MDVTALFEPALLIFTIPLLLACAFSGLALLGLFDLDGFDVDLDLGTEVDLDTDMDLDADADAGGGGVLQTLGLGMIPLSLFLILFCFSFGWVGLLLVSLLGSAVSSMVGTGLTTALVLALPAGAAAVLVTAPTARLLQPLFQDYGIAKGATELVGTVGVLSTQRVTSTFGSATVRMKGRGRVEVSVRADDNDDNDLDYGDRVLLYDYDPERNLYYVAPLNDNDLGRL